ncbi:MAG: tetrathionate reductase family octaheme c-type cytochrome [Ignavibacteria bacterium]|nr:tetrathionate reductase family octaheme c-type cytochrome [Ignavibacteria bacterium]
MKKIIISLTLTGLVLVAALSVLLPDEKGSTSLDILKAKYQGKKGRVADHSRYDILKQNFSDPRQVTKACLTCHTHAAGEIMQSNHWNWERPEYIKGRGIVYFGKKNAINNFCIGVEGNEQSCAKCHIGYGMSSAKNFAFNDSLNIDCLICHDNTETYSKGTEKAGMPGAGLDLANIARHVGKPKRSNCGVCHFFGGGGNNVKHGDLEKSMFEPARDVDVHMASDGANLQCVDCHTTKQHTISGKMYSLSSMNHNRAYCEDCHTARPHDDDVLNKHTLKVACQSCHINTYAKVNATKTNWDWATAGDLRNGEPYEVDDKDGNHTYLSIKGSFTWGKNLKPDYIWFNGTAEHYLLGDKFSDTTKPLVLNTLNGSYNDRDSKIIPVKIHTARQPYDPVNQLLIQPKLFAPEKGQGAFWKDFNWQSAASTGMKEINLPYSGKLTFIKTEMYWPVNHMIATKEKTVACTECHNSSNSRLAQLTDFYMPGRDHSSFLEFAGTGIIMLSLAGVLAHGGVRIYHRRKMKQENSNGK